MRRGLPIVILVAGVVAVILTIMQLASPASSNGADRFDRAWRDAAAVYSGERLTQARLEIRQQADDAHVQLTVPGAYPAASVSPSTTATPSASKPAKPAESWTPHYYTLDKGKRSARSFSPPVVGNAKAIKAEFAKRMKADPALLCANGGLILENQDGGVKCVKDLLKSEQARDAYFDKVMQAVDKMGVETLGAQNVESAYMLVGDDGIPRVYPLNVPRPEAYQVLTVHTKDGKTYRFRLECGFQWDNGKPRKPGSPKSTPPRDDNKPTPCVDGNGRDKDGKCRPPKPPTSSSPSPSNSTTPSSTPSSTPSTTPSPSPSCAGKTCETPPAAPTPRPTPSSTPTRSPENSPTATPTRPATTATPTVKAPSASAHPTHSASPAPKVSQSSAPADGDTSPGPRPTATRS